MAIDRFELQRTAGTLAPILDRNLADQHGERTGFVLLLFDFADRDGEGSMSYVTNGDRDGLVKMLRELLAKMESGMSSDPLGPKAVG